MFNAAHDLPNYADLRLIINTYRQNPDESILQNYACAPQLNRYGDGQDDVHVHNRVALMLALSADYEWADRALIRWLIRENGALYALGVDISQEMALCAFMLYKHMIPDDILVLYACKFAYGSSEQHAVDTEMVLGLGLNETLDYLSQHADLPHYQEMKDNIQHYCSGGAQFKTREQFIDFFEKRRFTHLQESLAECYDLIELI